MNDRCCHTRCAQDPIEGTSRCEKHTRHHRAEVAARAVAHKAAGKCALCQRPAVPGKARCGKHDSSLGVYRCGRCGITGHNRRTCTSA